MIFLNIIVGAVAGYFYPKVEPKIKEIAESVLLAPIKLNENEFDLVTLMLLMMLGHVVMALIGGESSVFMMCAGVLLGIFGERIWTAVMAKSEDKADASDKEPSDDA